jgi:hypothetical protein
VISRELDETIGNLVPAVEDLLQRLTGVASTVSEAEGSGINVVSPLRFPDGIGKGQVVVSLFRWREAVRIDVVIEHNRTFTKPDGSPSDQRCFMNDFQASITLPAGTAELTGDFERQVISGVVAARDAVERYNRRHEAPWSQVTVTAT